MLPAVAVRSFLVLRSKPSLFPNVVVIYSTCDFHAGKTVIRKQDIYIPSLALVGNVQL